jgi:restriction system protein
LLAFGGRCLLTPSPFIATSSFTPDAVEYAKNIGTRVILIDGARLASLMIKYGVAVQTRKTFTVVVIDGDFFD